MRGVVRDGICLRNIITVRASVTARILGGPDLFLPSIHVIASSGAECYTKCTNLSGTVLQAPRYDLKLN